MGESGCGKTVTAQSILRLYPERLVAYPQGQVLFEGRDILSSHIEEVRRIRGGRVGMIFQEPMSSLNPLHTVVKQLSETLDAAPGAVRRQGRRRLPGVAAAGRPAGPGAQAQRLPAPAIRRGAPAGHDRHGPGQPAAPADRRRADHRPGRDHPGPDPGADRATEARALHGGAVHHPRPVHRAPGGQPGGSDARRGAGGDGLGGADLRQSRAPLHQGSAGGRTHRASAQGRQRRRCAAERPRPEGLVSHPAGSAAHHPGVRQGRGRGHPQRSPRADPGGGGRERFGQDHPGQGAASPGVQPRGNPVREPTAARPEATRSCGPCGHASRSSSRIRSAP